MAEAAKRATVYFDPVVHRALRMKAAAADRSLSDMVNDAVRISLAEDAEDLAAPLRWSGKVVWMCAPW